MRTGLASLHFERAGIVTKIVGNIARYLTAGVNIPPCSSAFTTLEPFDLAICSAKRRSRFITPARTSGNHAVVVQCIGGSGIVVCARCREIARGCERAKIYDAVCRLCRYRAGPSRSERADKKEKCEHAIHRSYSPIWLPPFGDSCAGF